MIIVHSWRDTCIRGYIYCMYMCVKIKNTSFNDGSVDSRIDEKRS